jgi:hypothetical protein
MDGTASALAPASNVSATTRRLVGMTVQSFPASQPVTGRVPGAAGLVACVAGLVAVAAGLVTGLVAGGLGEDRAGELAADGEAAGVACLPGCVPPQAARPVAMAAARANRVISSVLMLPACAAHAGRQRPSVPSGLLMVTCLPSWGGRAVPEVWA